MTATRKRAVTIAALTTTLGLAALAIVGFGNLIVIAPPAVPNLMRAM